MSARPALTSATALAAASWPLDASQETHALFLKGLCDSLAKGSDATSATYGSIPIAAGEGCADGMTNPQLATQLTGVMPAPAEPVFHVMCGWLPSCKGFLLV
jgi:hypothetical protein